MFKEGVAMKPLPVGVSDFKDMIDGGYYYVEKTLLIKELLDIKAAVTLLPRPRRFGKTLNMSMLKYFFEKPVLPVRPFDSAQDKLRLGEGGSNVEGIEKSNAYLFENFAITKHPKCMSEQGMFPVIFFTFKDIKQSLWQDAYSNITKLIATEFERHAYILEKDVLSPNEKNWFNSVKNRQADIALYSGALKDLSLYLSRYYKQKTIILIDEYDSPIHAGFTNGYYNEIIDFMRPFLGGGLKDNNNLKFGVITGILRVSKECVLSDLNNLDVCTILDKQYQDHFGLNENDVQKMIDAYDLETPLKDIQRWYNGYTFGKLQVYNPWSIVNLIQKNGILKPYWVRSSVNDIIKNLLQLGNSDMKSDIELLMQDKAITKVINENVVFYELEKSTEMVWNFLLFTGYLTFKNYRQESDGSWIADLEIPNAEMMTLYRQVILGWFSGDIIDSDYKKMLSSLISGDISTFDDYFTMIVLKSFSYFDVSGKENQEPEKFYHAFVLGLLVSLSQTHSVKSNRESGLGRYDVMLIPLDHSQRGIVIEFKKVSHDKKETLEIAVQKALDQLEEKKYEIELHQMGIKNITKIGIAFDGKKTLIKEG
jgi:hypothetical protein